MINPTFRNDAKKFSLGTQVLPANVSFVDPGKRKFADPKCGFLPFDIQLRFYTHIGKVGEAVGAYFMYFPQNSVVKLTLKAGGLNSNYFEQVYLTGRNTFRPPAQSWVMLEQDTTQVRFLYLWIARINGQNKACVGFENARPRYVLHEMCIARIPPMAVWNEDGRHASEPKMVQQYYHGVYRFIDCRDDRFFAFVPIPVQARKQLTKASLALSSSNIDDETPIDYETCREQAENAYINISGKTVKVDGWTTDNESWDGEVYIRVIDGKTAKFENARDRLAGEDKYPNTMRYQYLSSGGDGKVSTDMRRGHMNIPASIIGAR